MAAVNGYAPGGNCELILACDLRIAAEDAFFGLPEVNLAGFAQMQRLSRLVGLGRAKQLILTAERISGPEAYPIGLIDGLAAPEQAIPKALALAQKIASKPPLTVQAAKRALTLGMELSLEDAYELELDLVGKVAGTADRAESLRAFLEKRPPDLEGR